MPAGRPSSYDQEIANEICRLMAEERASLRKICQSEDMPSVTTVFKWCRDIPEFAAQYARAMEERNHTLAQEIIDIADDSSIPPDGRRIMVDARKWLASKMLPKQYGDKLTTEVSGPNGGAIEHTITAIKWSVPDIKTIEGEKVLEIEN